MKKVIVGIITVAAIATLVWTFNKGKVEALEVEETIEVEEAVEVEEILNDENYEIEQAKKQGEEVLKLFDTLTAEKAYIKDIIYTTDLKQILIKVDGNEYKHEETSTIQLMIGILVSGIHMKDYSCKVVIQDINTNEIISKEIY